NASANTYFGNATGSSAAPSFSAAAALTKTDDANVTLTLGGSPSTSLLAATSLTLGWSGQLAISRGGTGSSTQNFVDLITDQTIAGTKTFTSAVIGVTPTLSTHLTTKGYVDGAFIPLTQKAANNGVATLDAGGKIPSSQLPTGALIYKGTWDASTNTPTLSDATGVNGWDYRVSIAGTQNLGSGNIVFVVGDEIIHNGTIYQLAPSATTVTSVNGLQGAVVLSTTNIAEGTNLYFTNAKAIAAPLTGYSLGTNTALAAGNSVLTAFQNVQGQLNARESSIAAGTTAQYWRGDKTFQTLDKTAVGLGSVENTALSTWAGTTNIITLGTIATGTWNATAIADGKIAAALTGKTYNALTLSAQAAGFTIAGGTISKTLTVPLDATVSGTNTGDQATISGNAGSATLTAITDDNATAATMYPTWVTTTSGNLAQKISSTKLSFNPSTGILTSVAFAGALTGNVTGNVTGSSGSTTGNAATVTTNANLTGDVTSIGNATTIAANAVTTSTILDGNVTYAKIQNISATDKILGRVTAGAGVIEEIATTGTGNVVRLTALNLKADLVSPTFTTPDIGVATGTSLALGGGTALTTTNRTGTGNLVLATSPTLITPVLGVATGTSLALGGGTALATTNQTGTGSLVLATSPSLITPDLGVATGTSLALGGGTALTTTNQTGTGSLVLAIGPTFTGVPAAPTAAAATNTTQLATTAFVTTADNLKAPLASPTFTGVPAAPTAAAATNTTQLATTAFVTTADNLKAPLASPTFTGVPAGPTAAVGTNTTELATTAFVAAAVPNASYRTILQVTGSHTAAKVAGTYALGDGDPIAVSGTGTLYPIATIYIAAADYPTVNGVTTKLRIRAQIYVNDVAPTGNYTFGLYPITRPGTSGAAGLDIYTLGTVVAGSNGATFTTPAADGLLNAVGVDFALPADGQYVIGVVTTATVATSSHLHLTASLQMHNL
ncbi:MAG TPA: hypothetical protein VE978_12975, partial [Chitinophagales bacterium]|nr:hypothetical protein [Chitinophagales bacterium]